VNISHPDAGPSRAGLRAALGMDRLKPLAQQASARGKAVSAVRRIAPQTRLTAVKGALMAIAALMGFFGFAQTVKPPIDPWSMSVIWNNLFRTLQLLTTQFPNDLPVNLPIELQIARFAMPVFTIWFVAAALLRRIDRPLLTWLAGLSGGHVVLIGASEINLALARAFRALKRPVIAIVPPVEKAAEKSAEKSGASPMELAGARIVTGDPGDVALLNRAAVGRASAVIAADDLGNAAMALASAVAAANARRDESRPPLTFLVRLAKGELRGLMGTHIASALEQNRVDLKLYVREQAVARALLGRYPSGWGLPPGDHDVHAVILGAGDMGAEILLQLARIATPTAGRRTILTVIDRDADALKERLLLEHPGLAHCAELRFFAAEIRGSAITASLAGTWLLEPLPATAIYVCCGDDHANLSIAIGLRRAYAHLRAVPAALFVYQRAGTLLVEALPHMHASVFDTLRIVPFGDIQQEANPFYLLDEQIDDLARSMHASYLANFAAAAAGATPAAVPWPELAETYRAANRSQADHVVLKLRQLGLHAAAAAGETAIEIDPEAIEKLSVQEHERWCRDRWLGGWIQAEERDDSRLHHPDLVPYDQLGERVRELDRQTVRALPALLGGLGIGLKRDRRIGVWFASTEAASAALLALVWNSVTATGPGDRADRHILLVLPLRNAAESALVRRLARHPDAGIEVALIGGIGPSFDRQEAREAIAASDRAYVLARTGGDAASVAALCDICDEVVVAGEHAAVVEALRDEVGEPHRARIELVALRGDVSAAHPRR
jgi:voltage-gated potassium channel Kch